MISELRHLPVVQISGRCTSLQDLAGSREIPKPAEKNHRQAGKRQAFTSLSDNSVRKPCEILMLFCL